MDTFFYDFIIWVVNFVVNIAQWLSTLWNWLTTTQILGRFVLHLPFGIEWVLSEGWSFVPINLIFGIFLTVILILVIMKKIVPLF